MAGRVRVYGGPADGSSVPRGSAIRTLRGDAGEGVYRLRDGRYVFAGYDARVCRGCGAVVLRRRGRSGRAGKWGPCQLCGASPDRGGGP